MSLMTLLYGNTTFRDGQEYLKFQYRFTCAILIFSTIITALLHISVLSGLNNFPPLYTQINAALGLLSVFSYVLVRGNPQRMRPIATVYAIMAWLQFVAAYFMHPADELRIIWFCLNLPGTYLILGQGAGIFATIASILLVTFGNSHLDQPYSINAVITCVLGLCYLSMFFHAFAARSISFHHAMVDANAKLVDMASKDPLTGLFNARAYYSHCDRVLTQAQRTGKPFAVLFVDLDHFKRINDTYGHEAGDMVLRNVAQCLTCGMRQSDMVGRIGGEEFSALLPETNLDGASQLAEKLRQDIESLMPDIGPQRLPITASIGVAEGQPNLVHSIADVQKQADQAMYVAKRQGRNRVTCINQLADMSNTPSG